MQRNAGDYVKSWGAALIRGAATNPEFTVCMKLELFASCNQWELFFRVHTDPRMFFTLMFLNLKIRVPLSVLESIPTAEYLCKMLFS